MHTAFIGLKYHIAGRAGFEIPDQFGEGDLSGKSTKNMDMIFHTADLKRVALQAPRSCAPLGRVAAGMGPAATEHCVCALCRFP